MSAPVTEAEEKGATEPGFFEILNTARAIKRLKPDPVPAELIHKVLDAGTRAPSGVNTQPWEFLVVSDEEGKARYHLASRPQTTRLETN